MTFDVITPTFFNLEEIKSRSLTLNILEMKLYDQKATNGAIGSLKLERF